MMNDQENIPAGEIEEQTAAGKEESKADRFKRLSQLRLGNAVKKIEIIGNLAGSGYEYTPEQAETILSSLKASLGEVEQKFQKGLSRQGFN